MSLIVLLILLPLVAGALVSASPAKMAKTIGLFGTLACVGVFLVLSGDFNWSAGQTDQLGVSALWFAPLGLKFSLAADTVSMLLVGLTVLLGPICVLASYTAISERTKTYYAWLLVLQSAMTGVFFARDLVLFYVFFEFTLLPMFILISLFGSDNRKYAAVKFFLYTFTGSMITLAGLAYVAIQAHERSLTGEWTFDFAALEEAARAMSPREQMWVFIALMAGFGVKVPIFPVHTWLPLAHTEAPTAGSVVLAGVLLKLGTYGIFRFAIQATPLAAYEFAPLMGVLAILGIVVAGLICWVQQDIKKLVAYSSVSHLGFCVLGLFALNGVGVSGSILYMINHGLSTGALFLLIGMVYERYHTRDFKKLGGLASKMPVWSFFMVFFAMASVGLPGLNGFISEFMCLLGAFQAGGDKWVGYAASSSVGGEALPGSTFGALGPWYAVFAGLGLIVTAMYILYMVGNIVWGKFKAPGHDSHAAHGAHGAHANGHKSTGQETSATKDHHGAHHGPLPVDLNAREIGVLIPLAIGCLWLGLYPSPMLRALEKPVQSVVSQVQRDVMSGSLDKPVVLAPAPAATITPAAHEVERAGAAHTEGAR